MAALWEFLLGWRLLWAYLSQTWYVPDETWQSVEVSHRMVFGTGHLTWEWSQRIRSSLHPLLFAIPLQGLKMTGLDSQQLVVLCPKLLQAAITAVGESALCSAVREVEGRRTGSWFFLITAFNWHGLYTGSRTLINTLEYSLTCLALSYYVRSQQGRKERLPGKAYLPLASLCLMIRPTAGLVWGPLVLLHFLQMIRRKDLVEMVWLVMAGVGVLLSCILVDSLYYTKLTLVPLNFFLVNVYNNLGVMYGTHPWHWYLSQGLPCLLGPLLLPLLPALRNAPAHLVLPVLVNIVFLSLLPHKEMRFLQPVMPFFFYLVARYLASSEQPRLEWAKRLVLTGNLLLALYLSLVHQRGAVDVALWLGQQEEPGSVLFLMPCHAVPFHSHFHANISARFLSCEPNLSGRPSAELDEADTFYADPLAWLNQLEPPLPRQLVLYDQLLPAIQPYVARAGYELCQSFFHTHLPEGRVGGRILLMCKI